MDRRLCNIKNAWCISTDYKFYNQNNSIWMCFFQLVVPGDSQEMKDFQEKTSVFSKLHIELNFPEIDANFQDPCFFELIYNRSVTNDICVCNKAIQDDTTPKTMAYDIANHTT